MKTRFFFPLLLAGLAHGQVYTAARQPDSRRNPRAPPQDTAAAPPKQPAASPLGQEIPMLDPVGGNHHRRRRRHPAGRQPPAQGPLREIPQPAAGERRGRRPLPRDHRGDPRHHFALPQRRTGSLRRFQAAAHRLLLPRRCQSLRLARRVDLHGHARQAGRQRPEQTQPHHRGGEKSHHRRRRLESPP